jgi:lipid II:glycine glycyltransferase (peptidoglycan interpeptide bridge formation enzyme)
LTGAPTIHLATPTDLADWDARAVHGAGGHVNQSVAWARHRERQGWKPEFLVADDGQPALALIRPWRGPLGGASAYLPRGPVAIGDVDDTARHLVAVTEFLAARGVDVVAADAEIPAVTGYAERLASAAFVPIEELEPSRHRLDVALPGSAGEAGLEGSFSATTRNLIRQGERQGLVVRRLDTAASTPLDGIVDTDPSGQQADASLGAFTDVVVETAGRRGFRLARLADVRTWAQASMAAGLSLLLNVERPDGEVIAGAMLYRHGGRLTYALAGERASARRAHPGATRLLIRRAMSVAISEGRGVMDLGGVDTRGARRMPREGEPQYGLLQFKQSFGAEWVEMTGAHERVIRPWRYLAGRVMNRVVPAR